MPVCQRAVQRSEILLQKLALLDETEEQISLSEWLYR